MYSVVYWNDTVSPEILISALMHTCHAFPQFPAGGRPAAVKNPLEFCPCLDREARFLFYIPLIMLHSNPLLCVVWEQVEIFPRHSEPVEAVLAVVY